jgi:protein gp37
MSAITSIQWADSTVNPIMGCGGCELYPSPSKILCAVVRAMIEAAPGVNATPASVKAIYSELVNDAFQHGQNPHPGHKFAVNTTNIWHLRNRFASVIEETHGPAAAQAASEAIRKAVTCYAAILHLNKGANILDREGNRPGKNRPRGLNPGYAPIFETITPFKDRCKKVAALKDLLGHINPLTPWKGGLPRMIFVSDMGDALSAKADFPFLKNDMMPAITSVKGRNHLWLWLSKRPARMTEFAKEIGGFPANVCAMTTLTGPDPECLQRLAHLKKVDAKIRGLSIEPLRERIPLSELDLSGIDWVIVGGESGAGELTRPFSLEWAEELSEHCRKNGVAFFLKQVGRNPSRNGEVFRLKNKHGGNWEEWDEALRIREFPRQFHDYRKDEMPASALRPVSKSMK